MKVKSALEVLDIDFLEWVVRKEMEEILDSPLIISEEYHDKLKLAARIIKDYYSVEGN